MIEVRATIHVKTSRSVRATAVVKTKEHMRGDCVAHCRECGVPYEDLGLDITLPDWQWGMIHPEVGGILCGNCIAKRAEMLPGAIAIRARIEFADASTESASDS